MKKLIYSFLMIGAAALAACSPQQQAPTATTAPTAANPAVTLAISGSGSVTPILAAIADEFEAANPGYVLEILPGSGTGGGVRGVVDGTLDVAAMSRPANDSETEQGIQFVPFGSSVTAIMTHPGVGVSELTTEQLTGILTGTVTNWSAVGGDDLEIVVYVRDPEESNTSDIRETFIGEVEFAQSAQVMTSQTDMQNVLTTIEGAIGYGTWATAVAGQATVASVTVGGMGLDNAPETLIGAFGVGYLTDRADDVQPLIDWLSSEAGRAALTAVGVNPVASE